MLNLSFITNVHWNVKIFMRSKDSFSKIIARKWMSSAERKHCVTSENIFQIFETTQNNMTSFSVMHLEKWGTKYSVCFHEMWNFNVIFDFVWCYIHVLYVLLYAFTKYSGDNSLRFCITQYSTKDVPTLTIRNKLNNISFK